MSEYKGNPEIAKLGEATRFGSEKGFDPSNAGVISGRMRETIRPALRRLSRAELGTNPTVEKLCAHLGRNPDTLLGGELLAIKNFIQAMNNYKAMEKIIDNIDGKQVERKVESKVTLAQLLDLADTLPDEEPDNGDV